MSTIIKLNRSKFVCPHCHSSQGHAVECATCCRDMCDYCITICRTGHPLCGLCYDRDEAHRRWKQLPVEGRPPFETWYDQQG